MKYPNLVPLMFCKTPVTIKVFSDDYNDDGSPVEIINYTGTCNFQSTNSRSYSNDKTYINLNAICLLPGDFCPDYPEPSAGEVLAYGKKYSIHKYSKCRNLDGTVNFTKLELI